MSFLFHKSKRNLLSEQRFLNLHDLAETAGGGADSGSGSGGQSPGTSSHDLLASLATPDTDGLTLDGILMA